jgi:N-ethylmaleimide reductase
METTTQLAQFSPVKLGALQLKHRIVMAPLTRSRADQPDAIPNDLMAEYYGRACGVGRGYGDHLWQALHFQP